jgi:membrane glycosyltransferase
MPSKAVAQQTAVQLLGEQESSWRAASKRPVGRLLVFVGWPLGVVLLLAAYRELLLGAGLSGTGLTAVLLLFVPFGLFLAIGMTTWILGVVASARKRLPAALQWPVECSVKGLTVQTAIVFPIKNEDTAQVFANVATVREELRDIGANHLFDIYVVSNSDDPNCWVEEELAWHTVSRKYDRAFY